MLILYSKSAIRKATGLSDLVSCHVSHCYGAQAVSLTFPTGFKFSYSGDTRPSTLFAEIGQNSTVLLHEATFDDELNSEAVAKKHSTTSEAIGVGVAMRARRMILTHFSQRYQNVPSVGGLDTRTVNLEDAEDVDDPSAGMDQSIEESAHVIEAPALSQTDASELPSEPRNKDPVETTASNTNSIPQSQFDDMKIGVAFDYMRVKVKDIIHLEKFTPALNELYKDSPDETEASPSAEAVEIKAKPKKKGGDAGNG